MILKNLSHEYLVMDEKYGNLKGYKYHYTTYLSNKIVEDADKKNPQASFLIFKERLQKTIRQYKELKYIIEQKKLENDNHITSIYDIDEKGNKRFMVTEITINKKEFKLYNFETSKFAEKFDGTKGIIPEILQELLDAREMTKKEMGAEKDKFKRSVLDGKQLAEKVTANSLYGQCGSPVSAIYMKEIAASTTATGKEHLELSRDFLEGPFDKLINLALTNKKDYLKLCNQVFGKVEESKFNQPRNGFETREQFYEAFYNKMTGMMKGHHTNIKSIYGDSVVGESPILLKDPKTNEIIIKRIDEIGSEWREYNNYKNGEYNDYIMNIINILIRKPIYNEHCKHKTDEKSIINGEYNIINKNYRLCYDPINNYKYLEVKLEELDDVMLCDVDDIDILSKGKWKSDFSSEVIKKLKSQLPKIIQDKINKNNYQINHINNNLLDNRKCNLRLIGYQEQNWNTSYKSNYMFEQINKEYNSLYNELKELLIKDQKDRYSKEQSITNYLVYTNNGWAKINRIIRHKTNKKIYRIITGNSMVDVTSDHSLIDENGDYVMPKDCRIGKGLMQSYPDIEKGQYQLKYDIPVFTSKNQKECMEYYHYNKSNQYNILINYYEGEIILQRINREIRNPNKIINIIDLGEIGTDKYVYDLETEHGRFHAGIGELIVTNTDSVFYKPRITDNETGEIKQDFWARECSIQIGIWSSIAICLVLSRPMQMEYEKVLHPFVIITKKRYVGNLYEKDPNKFSMKSMGIVLKRRDNASIVKIVVGGIVDQILNKHS